MAMHVYHGDRRKEQREGGEECPLEGIVTTTPVCFLTVKETEDGNKAKTRDDLLVNEFMFMY